MMVLAGFLVGPWGDGCGSRPADVSPTGWGPPLTEASNRELLTGLVALEGSSFAVWDMGIWHVFDPSYGEVARTQLAILDRSARWAWWDSPCDDNYCAPRPGGGLDFSAPIDRFPPAAALTEAPVALRAEDMVMGQPYTPDGDAWRAHWLFPVPSDRELGFEALDASRSALGDRMVVWGHGRVAMWSWIEGRRWQATFAEETKAILTRDGRYVIAEQGGRLAVLDAATGERLDDPERDEPASPHFEHPRMRRRPPAQHCEGPVPGTLRYEPGEEAELRGLEIEPGGCGIAWIDSGTVWFADPASHELTRVAEGVSWQSLSQSYGELWIGEHAVWNRKTGLRGVIVPWREPTELAFDDHVTVIVQELQSRWALRPDGAHVRLEDGPPADASWHPPPPIVPPHRRASRTVYPGPRATRVVASDGSMLCELPASDRAVLSDHGHRVAWSLGPTVGVASVVPCEVQVDPRVVEPYPGRPAGSEPPLSVDCRGTGPDGEPACRFEKGEQTMWLPGSWTHRPHRSGSPAGRYRVLTRATDHRTFLFESGSGEVVARAELPVLPASARTTDLGTVVWLEEGRVRWQALGSSSPRTVPRITAAQQLEHVPGGLLVAWEPGRVHLLDEAGLRSGPSHATSPQDPDRSPDQWGAN